MSVAYDNSTVDPTGPDGGETDGQFAKLKKWVIDGHRARSGWRKEAIRAYDFVANHQWSEDDKILLSAQHRPSVTFNRTAPIIKAICGLEVNNRQSVVYLPRKQGDGGVDESRTNAAKWVRDQCSAEDEESEAFRDLTICGEGWTETRMDYDTRTEGQIVEERMDPLEMGTNEGASRSNYADARCIYRIRELDTDDAKALFDEPYDAQTMHAAWIDPAVTPADGGTGNKKDYPSETRAALERDSGRRTKVRLVQIQWWDRERVHLVAQQDVDKLQELSGPDFDKFKSRADAMEQNDTDALSQHAADMETHAQGMAAHVAQSEADPVYAATVPPPVPPTPPTPTAPQYQHAQVMRKVYYEAFLGSSMLGEPRKLDMGEFQFKAMTGERDRTDKCFYGMVRDMFDPQMWANKWLSQTMHIMNTNAKGGIMAETDAFVNQRRAEKDWADNTKIIWVKPGSLEKNKIKERTPPPLPQGLGELMQFALSSLRDVTGVNLELLGQADREQAASLEAQRRQAAMTILATLFDSLRRYRKDQGRLTLKFVELLPEGTLYGVLEQGQYKYVPLIKKGDINEYDVIIDEAPTSPDQKQAIWAITSQLLTQGIPLPPPAIIALLKYSPYPESVVQEIKEAMGLGTQIPPDMLKQKLDQAEQALHVMEQHLQEALANAKTAEDKHTIEELKVDIEGYRAETERLAAEWASEGTTQKRTGPLPEDVPSPTGDQGGLAQEVASIKQLLMQLLQGQGGGGAPPSDPNAPPADPNAAPAAPVDPNAQPTQ